VKPWFKPVRKRIRANAMTVCTTVLGLLPVFWATGRGAE
jgi:Cu/Ag efflux pump CusA